MATRHRQRALKGRQSTPPAPSLEELLTVTIDRREAFHAGHQAALFDELHACLTEAYRRHDAKPIEDLPVLPDGSRDRRIRSDADATVTVPLWAFDVVYNMVMDRMLSEARGTGATARWWQKYRKDLIHWHRYACVRQALKARRATWLDVYDVVARDLRGTAFAAKASGIKNSVEEVVVPALKNGQQSRFYRSAAARVYDFLLNTPGPVTVVPGALLVKSAT